MKQANLEDIYDARDISEVVFRTMRDLMTTEATDRVTAELSGGAASASNSSDKAVQSEVAVLWQDTNPVVRFLSRVRPPLEIAGDTFLFRISQEAGLSRGVSPEEATTAVFSALKAELSSEQIQEINSFLPGTIQQMWRRA